jgi:serine-type D-Ala-D-Ala carboxypeptidase/endopeptidase (penicillin-binding protein 4)
MKYASRLCLVVLLCAAMTAQAALPVAVGQALAHAGIPAEAVGLWVSAPDTGRSLAHQEQQVFNPASVMKLVTTMAALDRLGPAHTFATEVYTDGPLKDGVLQGALYIKGGGDPTLTIERASSLLRALRARGVRVIQGDLTLDMGHYALPALDPAGFDAAPERPYNAPPAALLVNYNTIALTFSPRLGGVALGVEPPTLRINAAIRGIEGPCNGWQEPLRPRIHEGEITLEGDYPLACGTRTTWFNLLNPADNSAMHLTSLWQELGGTLQGGVRLAATPATAELLLSFPSKPLAEIVRDINKHSNNVMARMVLLNLGAIHAGGAASPEHGQQAIHAWLAQRGLTLPGLVIDNGAGLAREARLTPEGLGQLLRWASAQSWFFEFAASLPAWGVDGTLRQRRSLAQAVGRAHLKTGSLRGVRAWAGFVPSPQGVHVVVLFINHANAGQAGLVIEAVLGALVPFDAPADKGR